MLTGGGTFSRVCGVSISSARSSTSCSSLSWVAGAGLAACWGARDAIRLGHLVGSLPSNAANGLPPFLGILRSVCPELELVAHAELATKRTFGGILTLHCKLEAVESADNAVGEVQGDLRNRVFGKVVISLEFVQVLGRSDCIVCSVVSLEHLALALKRACDKRLSGTVVAVGESDIIDAPWWCVGVNHDVTVPLQEASPLKVWCYARSGCTHVAIKGAGVLGLLANYLNELIDSILESRNDVRLKLGERVLDGKSVLAIVVLLLNLPVQTMVDTSLNNIWVVACMDLTTSAVKGSGVLTEEFNMLLCGVPGFVNELGTLSSTLCELLGLVLNLRVQTLEDG